MRGCLTPSSQQVGFEESERDSQQGGQSDMAEGEVIVDYDLEVDYEGSKPKVALDAQKQRGFDPDTA